MKRLVYKIGISQSNHLSWLKMNISVVKDLFGKIYICFVKTCYEGGAYLQVPVMQFPQSQLYVLKQNSKVIWSVFSFHSV